MSDTVSILKGTANSYQTTAEHFNAIATDILNDGIVGAFTATSGVAPMTGALASNAQGSPNMTVAVTAGICYVTATPAGQSSQRLRANVAAQNATIASNATGGTRFDWIYVKIDPTTANAPNVSGSDVASVVVSRSTSASVDNGTPPTYGFNISVVTVANGASSITNGNIADKRSAVNTVNSSSSLSNPYKFRVRRNAAFTPGGTAKVTFDTEDYDTGGNFDSTTNNRFTAPVAGFYQFNARVSFTGATASTETWIALYKNGSLYQRGGQNVINSFGAIVFADVVQSAAADYWEIFVRADNGSTETSAGVQTYFSGYLVSAT